MRQGAGVRFALLGVVSQNPDGVHGYALKRQCDRVLGSFWQLNLGEVYRVLDRLAGEQLIEPSTDESESSRKVYRITEKGRRTLDDFVLAPPADAPRALRHELAVKLLFAPPTRLREVLALIDHQRDTYARQLSGLRAQRRRLGNVAVDPFIVNLLIDHAELSVRAELTWLDGVSEKLRERQAATELSSSAV